MKRPFIFYISFFVLSLALCFALSPIGAVSFPMKSLAAFIFYAALTFFGIKKNPGKNVFLVLAVSTPPLLLYGFIHFENLEYTIAALPASTAHVLGILFGYLLCAAKKKLILSIVMIAFASAYSFYGYSIWSNKVLFDYFLVAEINEPAPEMKFIAESGQEISDREIEDKILVLDFWTTRCAACFEKFPLLQQQYNRWKNNPEIAFYAVNIPLKRDTAGQAFAALRKMNYTFPAVISKDKDQVTKAGVTAYPTVLIIDKNRIVFRGRIDNVEQQLRALQKNR